MGAPFGTGWTKAPFFGKLNQSVYPELLSQDGCAVQDRGRNSDFIRGSQSGVVSPSTLAADPATIPGRRFGDGRDGNRDAEIRNRRGWRDALGQPLLFLLRDKSGP